MRVIFTVSKEWSKDLQRMKQFEICLLGQRMMSPNCRMLVQIPKGWWYPTTWKGLQEQGVKITRTPIEEEPGDIYLTGTHISITALDKLAYPCTPEHELQIPHQLVNFEQAIQWAEANRRNDARIWLPISAHNPHYWASKPHATKLPLIEWLQWAYWRKAQPKIQYATRTFYFPKKWKLVPPVKGM
tara:strand:- start:3567 stop:4124 length:558 start_codon:yes stop_codon:yes gene_type:complete